MRLSKKNSKVLDVTANQELKEEARKKEQKQDKQHHQYTGSIYGRLFGYTEGSRCYFFIGVIAALTAGAIHPCSALFLANVVNEQFTIYFLSSDSTVGPDSLTTGSAIDHA